MIGFWRGYVIIMDLGFGVDLLLWRTEGLIARLKHPEQGDSSVDGSAIAEMIFKRFSSLASPVTTDSPTRPLWQVVLRTGGL